jgi:hypothetical protein
VLTRHISPIDEVHDIAGNQRSGGKRAVVARKRGLGCTEYRDYQRYDSSARDWSNVRSSRAEGMGKVILFPR